MTPYRISIILLTWHLLLSREKNAVSSVLEKPMLVYVNSSSLVGISDNSNVTENERNGKMIPSSVKKGANSTRKDTLRYPASYSGWSGAWNFGNNNSFTVQPINITTAAALTNKSDTIASTTSKISSLALKGTNSVTSRSASHRKNHHANHYTVHRSEEQDRRKIYLTSEDYEQNNYNNHAPETNYHVPQVQEYEDTYNTIPEDQSNSRYNFSETNYHVPQVQEYEDTYNTIPEDQSNSGYDGSMAEPWRQTAYYQDPGYFGPPIPTYPVYDDSPVPVRECHCPAVQVQRQAGCADPSGTFLTLLGALAGNLWQLAQLVVASSLPFIIPLVIAKIIIIPLKILGFLKLIKIFIKLFIILPFFIRVVHPAIVNAFLNLHSFIFQKLQDLLTPPNHSPHPHFNDAEGEEEAEGRIELNSTNPGTKRKVNDTSTWDLRSCPSRVACELGAYLSASTVVDFPQKLADYLTRKADHVESRNKRNSDEDDENDNDYEDYEDEDDEDDRLRRDETFKAFVLALGKKWTQDKCSVYKCAVLF